jgi:hypothetical protein
MFFAKPNSEAWVVQPKIFASVSDPSGFTQLCDNDLFRVSKRNATQREFTVSNR